MLAEIQIGMILILRPQDPVKDARRENIDPQGGEIALALVLRLLRELHDPTVFVHFHDPETRTIRIGTWLKS